MDILTAEGALHASIDLEKNHMESLTVPMDKAPQYVAIVYLARALLYGLLRIAEAIENKS